MLVIGLAIIAGYVIADNTGFNIMPADQELLRMKNQTQGTVNWSDPLSANAGDQVTFLAYYHCGTDAVNWSQIKALATGVRLEFPTTAQTSVVTTARVYASNLAQKNDNAILNLTSAQKLTFNSSAVWYHDSTSTNIAVSTGNGYVQAYLGDVDCDYSPSNCYSAAGYVVFTATVSSIFTKPTVDLKVNGSDTSVTIPYNTAANLTWTSTNATSCTASGDWSGAKAISSGGDSTGNLTSNKTYSIVCTGPGGTSDPDTVSVNVSAPSPTVDLKINGSDTSVSVSYNGSATLSWTSTNATSCTASGDWSGAKAISSGGESTGNLTSSKTYTIVCTGPGGTSNYDTVSANVQVNPPTVNLKANGSDGPITITYNTPANLWWVTTNEPTSCIASGAWSGAKATAGGNETTGNLTLTQSYTIFCSNSAGSSTDSVLVQVLHCLPAPPPLPY